MAEFSFNSTVPSEYLEQSQYDFTSRVFPEDLTMEDNNHYMVININVPIGLLGNFRGYYYPGIVTSADMLNEDSKVDKLRFPRSQPTSPGENTLYDYGASIIGGFGNLLEFFGETRPNRGALDLMRSTKRIKQSIALHMPQGGLVYTEKNNYQPISMTALMGDAFVAATTVAGGVAGKSLTGAEEGAQLGSIVRDAAGKVMSSVGNIATGLGMPLTPTVQILFASRDQRTWTFEVFMMPRTENEAKTVKEIVRDLRFFSAPEINQGGFTYIPPAEFDITFYRGGKENLNLPRINTCVLEQIDVDYAPQGEYSVFDKDGHSIAVRMTLSFKEIEVLHKQRIAQGF